MDNPEAAHTISGSRVTEYGPHSNAVYRLYWADADPIRILIHLREEDLNVDFWVRTI